jgi:hypothetical protein
MLSNNRLLIEIDAHHAAIKIVCDSCDNGKPHSNDYGFNSVGHREGNWYGYLSFIIPDKCRVMSNDATFVNSEDTVEAEVWNTHVKEFPLTSQQAEAALSKVREIAAGCEKQEIKYSALFNDCVTFAQQIYSAAGLKGHFGDNYSVEELLPTDETYPRAGVATILASQGAKGLLHLPQYLKNAFYYEILHATPDSINNNAENLIYQKIDIAWERMENDSLEHKIEVMGVSEPCIEHKDVEHG